MVIQPLHRKSSMPGIGLITHPLSYGYNGRLHPLRNAQWQYCNSMLSPLVTSRHKSEKWVKVPYFWIKYSETCPRTFDTWYLHNCNPGSTTTNIRSSPCANFWRTKRFPLRSERRCLKSIRNRMTSEISNKILSFRLLGTSSAWPDAIFACSSAVGTNREVTGMPIAI